MSKRSAGQGGVCGTALLLLPHFGEFVLRQSSPRPSGTPLINAGGKGLVLIEKGRAVLCTAGDADCHVAPLLAMTGDKNTPVPVWNGGKMQQIQILPYRSVMVRIFWASSLVAKPGWARQVQLALVRVPGWFMRPSPPISR